MADLKKCDRCGKEIENDKGSWIQYRYHCKNLISVYIIPKEGKRIYQEFDLCPNCATSFMSWLLDIAKKEAAKKK